LWLMRPVWAAAFSPAATSTPTLTMQAVTTTLTATLLPSATTTPALPTLTSTPVPPHLLETPVGLTHKLLVHQVKDGESLILLAETYQTSAEAIQTINLSNGTFWAGSLIVIPVGQTDVTAYPRFKVILIDTDGTLLSDLAARYSVDAGTLAQDNSLPADYIFHKGEWALIPAGQQTP